MAEQGTSEFERHLRVGAERLGLSLTEDGIRKLLVHNNLLLKWSGHVNLTTVRDPVGMAERLYLDSAALMRYLEKDSSLHDVGTGAGFPGLVLKALMPELDVTLTEARRKKVSFLKQVVREMQIEKGIEIRWARLGWEDCASPGAKWVEVVSRAAFPPPDWLAAGWRLVAPGGRLWILLGSADEANPAELEWLRSRLPGGLVHEKTMEYRLPFCGIRRLLVSLRRPAQC